MFVNAQQFELGVNHFVENEIAKKAVGFNKFAVYFAMPIINKKIETYIETFHNNELLKDIFDENRNIDVDKVYNMAKSAIQKSGQFVYYGIVFNESDIDKLYSYIRGEL